MSLRCLTGYVCAAAAALFLSHNAADAMVRSAPGLAPLAHAATVDAVGDAAIVKVARFGDRSGGRVGGRSFHSFRGPSRSFHSFRGRSRSFRGYRGFRRDFRGPRRIYRGFRSGRHFRRHYRGRRYYTPITPYFYGYYPYTYYYYQYPSGRCAYWHRRCVANWGYRNSNYYGCMRYYGCL